MIAEVIVDIASSEVDRIFDYTAGPDIVPGMRVSVPFGNKLIEGFVIGLKDKSDYADKLKSVAGKLDDFVAVGPEMFGLMDFMVDKYHLRKIDVLRLFVPAQLRGGRVGEILLDFVQLALPYEEAVSMVSASAAKQIAAIEYLKDAGGFSSELNKLFGASALKALKDKGITRVFKVRKMREPDTFESSDKSVKLNANQREAVDRIDRSNGVILLHGVTGSGKTEVYMNAVSHALDRGKTAIVLVPEISLTPQLLSVFRARFGAKAAVLHSGLSAGERFDEWKRLLTGEASIAIGARSAIFAPLSNIGLIVIDEEHDGSYVSESNPRYDAKEVARFRAGYYGAPLVLGSATPQIESYYKAQTGEYELVSLPDRINKKKLPEVEIVNMSREIRMGNREIFSSSVKQTLENCLADRNQAIIFINRRGYFSYVMCRDCGFIAKCESCDVSLTYHKTENVLKCHCCGKTYRNIEKCPHCGSTHLRQGHTGTEQVAEEVKKLFPHANVARMDNDSTRKKGAHAAILKDFADGKADVLVGTQMISKGHDFKRVALVCILEADYSLYMSDYRSNERTFQLVTQVAGRAGREGLDGKVILQTYTPKHYVFRYAAAYDYQGFYEKELNTRQVTKFPPFAKIVRVLISSPSDEDAKASARKTYDALTKVRNDSPDDFIYFQGMKSPVEREMDMYRYQVLMRIKQENADKIIRSVYTATDKCKNKKSQIFVEINPQNLN